MSFEAILYKNKYNAIGTILNEWIDGNITYKYDDIDTFTIKIPRKVGDYNNPIYDIIATGNQIIIDNNGKKDRFYISEKSTYNNMNKNDYKTFNCYQWQKKLDNIEVEIEQATYQLSNTVNPNLYPTSGLLQFVSDNSPYSIGHIDNTVAYNTEETDEVLTISFKPNNVENVKNGTLLYDIDVDFNSIDTEYGKQPIYVNITYGNIKTTDNSDYGVVYNDFDLPFYKDIKNIKAYYNDTAGNRYSIKYIFTYSDNETIEFIKNFVNVMNKTTIFDEVTIKHTTGKKVKGNQLQYLSYDETTTTLGDLLSTISEKFDCVFIYNNIDMIIDCYDKKTYGTLKPLELSLESNCIDITTNENSEDLLCTQMTVNGQDYNNSTVSISNYNIFGGNVIYNYDYYIKNELLPKDTIEHWNKYIKQLEINQDKWSDLKTKANDINSRLIVIETEIDALNQKIVYTSNILSEYMVTNNNDGASRMAKEKKEYEDRLSKLLLEKTTLDDNYKEVINNISNFSIENKRENITTNEGVKIFNEKDLEILDDFKKNITYDDTYFVTGYSLYNYYKEKMSDITIPTIDFSINMRNVDKYLALCNNIFELGMLHLLDNNLQKILGIEQVRLTEMQYSPSKNKWEKFSFSTKYKKKDLLSNLKSLGKSNSKTSKTLSNYSDIVSKANLSTNFVKSMREGALNDALNVINGKGERNIIDINSAGIWIKDANDENNQVYIGASCIGFTNNKWNTCKLALTSDGISADYLIGRIILGENLALDSDNGCFYIGDGDNVSNDDKGDFGLYVFDKTGTVKTKRIFLGIQQQNNGDYQARLELYSKEGDKVVLSDEGVMQTDTNGYEVYLDHDNSAYVPFYIDEGVKSIDKFLLRIRKGRLRSTTKSTETSLSANINIQGQTVSTSTSAEGSHNHTVTINIPAHYHLVFGSTGIVSDGVPKNAHWGEYVDMNDNKIYLPIATASGLQTEPLYTRGEGGKYVSTVTSNATGSHSHTVNISGSSQHLNLSHNHKLQYGIFTDSSIASVVAIYVNGNAVNTHITGGSYEVDIKDYIKIGGWNEIEFRANGNCCINFAYFMKSFNKF